MELAAAMVAVAVKPILSRTVHHTYCRTEMLLGNPLATAGKRQRKLRGRMNPIWSLYHPRHIRNTPNNWNRIR